MFKYTKAELAEKANEMNFVRDTLEKVLRLSEILNYLNSNPLERPFGSGTQRAQIPYRIQSKKYSPELLFDNSDILSRIKEHPMALWKVREV